MSLKFKTPALVAALLCTTAILPVQQANAFLLDNPTVDGTTDDTVDGTKNTDGTKARDLDLSEIKEKEEAALAEEELETERVAELDPGAMTALPGHTIAASPVVTIAASSSTNLVYGASFIARFPNAVSALDLVRRIPGSGPILQRGQNSNSRGFGSNDDGVLINGKRLSGKDNNSQDALGRIRVDQVDHVEIIRGGSPDVKVSSQEAMVNVVLKEGQTGGSGTWQADLRGTTDGRVRPGGKISYSGKTGQLEYFAEAKVTHYVTDIQQRDDSFDGANLPLSTQREEGDQNWRGIDFSSNLTYNLSDGDQIRLNGKFTTGRMNRPWFGELFDPVTIDGVLAYQEAGESIRYQNNKTPSRWEIGGDYGTNLSESLKFKFIGLHSENKFEMRQSEDFLIENDTIEEDFVFKLNRFSTESVGRVSLDWDIGGGTSLEVGEEVALNKVASKLNFQELIPGQGLVSQTISGADVTVKETRSESFANYSMKLNDKMNLDASLKYEYSKISQLGVGVDTSKTLNYFKPSIDYRYNITKGDQFQVSYRREISQLNFGDFASSASQDDEVVAGNANLEPEKTWKFETSYEHRLGDDAGRIKGRFVYDRIADVIQRIEITPGVSGVGNAGKATRYRYEVSGSLRMGFIGIPDMVLDGKVFYIDGNVTDPFTGQDHPLNFENDWVYNLNLRHDINDLGLSWNVQWWHDGNQEFHDIDEVIRQPQGKDWVDVYIEYKVFKGTTLKLGLENIINPNAGRVRELYDGGVAGGVLTGQQVRRLQWGRRFVLSLKGTF